MIFIWKGGSIGLEEQAVTCIILNFKAEDGEVFHADQLTKTTGYMYHLIWTLWNTTATEASEIHDHMYIYRYIVFQSHPQEHRDRVPIASIVTRCMDLQPPPISCLRTHTHSLPPFPLTLHTSQPAYLTPPPISTLYHAEQFHPHHPHHPISTPYISIPPAPPKNVAIRDAYCGWMEEVAH